MSQYYRLLERFLSEGVVCSGSKETVCSSDGTSGGRAQRALRMVMSIFAGSVKSSGINIKKLQIEEAREAMSRCADTDEALFSLMERNIPTREYALLLGRTLRDVFKDEESLQRLWSSPETRDTLLSVLGEQGFVEADLDRLRQCMHLENCDMLDVLRYLGFGRNGQKPMTRRERVKRRWHDIFMRVPRFLDDIIREILERYQTLGEKVLALCNIGRLKELIRSKIAAMKQMFAIADAAVDLCCYQLQIDLYMPEPQAVTLNITNIIRRMSRSTIIDNQYNF